MHDNSHEKIIEVIDDIRRDPQWRHVSLLNKRKVINLLCDLLKERIELKYQAKRLNEQIEILMNEPEEKDKKKRMRREIIELKRSILPEALEGLKEKIRKELKEEMNEKNI